MEYDEKKEVFRVLDFCSLYVPVELGLFVLSLTLCDLLFRFGILSVRLHSLHVGNRNCPIT